MRYVNVESRLRWAERLNASCSIALISLTLRHFRSLLNEPPDSPRESYAARVTSLQKREAGPVKL
ncbi:hypothetical protein PUN28_010859 [Cardiocondyla obscurior]|uniref:Uncharacterized protein n=1 Tax=Cardiocondyla obscurior TaxID=286306 RepID=A0AAW2FLH3_9HYME